jgi:hypothetical protein
MENFDLDNVDLPVDGIEVTNEEISFNDNGTINDDVYVQEFAAPEAQAVVVEEEIPVMTEDVVEETIPAPVAVVEEPTYVAPIEEPVHHVRWPWALLALPLLAIPFIPRHQEPVPVAEPVRAPVVVDAPVVRPSAPAARAVAPKATPAPAAKAPTCAGTWTVNDSVVLRGTAAATGAELQTLAPHTAVDVKSAAEAGWYKVAVGADNGYLPVNVVVCTLPTATTTITG